MKGSIGTSTVIERRPRSRRKARLTKDQQRKLAMARAQWEQRERERIAALRP
jgi:hypothetical protein